MDLFKDCEIQRMHLRGHAVVLIVGDRAVSAQEGAELLAQYAASFGRSTSVPAYVSRDGWQLLNGRAKRQAETDAVEPASNTPESATQAVESDSKGPESGTKPAEPETPARPVIHAQHKKGGR